MTSQGQTNMNQVTGSWAVDYNDGTSVAQYNPDGTKTKFREIDWSKAEKLILESQLVRQVFDVTPPEEEFNLALRSRHFVGMSAGAAVMCFMLVKWAAEDAHPDDNNTETVMYWVPNGTVHHCTMFNCPDVATYCSNHVHNQPTALMPNHGRTIVAFDAKLT